MFGCVFGCLGLVFGVVVVWVVFGCLVWVGLSLWVTRFVWGVSCTVALFYAISA